MKKSRISPWVALALLVFVAITQVPRAEAIVSFKASASGGATYTIASGGSSPSGQLALPVFGGSLEVGIPFFTVAADIGYVPRAYIEGGYFQIMTSLYFALAPRFWVGKLFFLDAGGFFTINTSYSGSGMAANDYGLRAGLGVAIPLFRVVKLLVSTDLNITFASHNGRTPHFLKTLVGVMVGI